MSVATVVESVASRHALVAADDCECGMCGPTWARRRGKSRRFTQPVTLVAAMQGEDPGVRAAMVEEHQQCLAEMVRAADELVAGAPLEHPLLSGVGLGLVMFAGELAWAIRPDEFGAELPERVVSRCTQTVSAAMVAAAGCLAGLVGMYQALVDSVG
jgi:hypothetical protein